MAEAEAVEAADTRNYDDETASQAAPSNGNTSRPYYAISNLRLRSEPDTSVDNRIVSISRGDSVELLETGRTDSIDGITAPWYRVRTADGTTGWVFSGYLSETPVFSQDFEMDGTVLVKYNGNAANVTIPAGVTAIGDSAFFGRTSLTSITIPSSVTSIGDGAFVGCTSLTSITIPSRITSIGGGIFWGCVRLTSVTIPSSVTSIGVNAFFGCISLSNITIPISVTKIEGGAFLGCPLSPAVREDIIKRFGQGPFELNERGHT